MKVVILAGGFGTRLSDYTDRIPKPMVSIGNIPIIYHIMKRYSKYGYKEFLLALGYKSQLIKEYFLNYTRLNSDFTVDLKSGVVTSHKSEVQDWKVTLVNTGLNTMTGGRLKKIAEYCGNEPFMVTYGDGVADINISELVEFHEKHRKIATVTAVRPLARFGVLNTADNGEVISFKEKPQLSSGWINGGFFVFQPQFLDFISGDDTILEREPLEKASQLGELMAYKHYGFWQCMDSKRDRDLLQEMFDKGDTPWLR